MHLTAQHQFAAPPDRVYAMSIDPEFLATACRDLAALEHSVSVEPNGDGAVTRVSMEAETIPALAKLAGATITVGQEMSWGPAAADGSRQARVLIKVAGLPVLLDATARLAPTASGSVIDYAGDFTVNVPLVGGLLEKQAAPFVTETLDVQQRSGNHWLAAH